MKETQIKKNFISFKGKSKNYAKCIQIQVKRSACLYLHDSQENMSALENFFAPYRKHITGIDACFEGKPIIYADWTASGRVYGPIERILSDEISPYVANTHTETNFTGSLMTRAYHESIQIIKKHIGASADDALISSNSGMTGVVNKLQRILGLKVHENFIDQVIPQGNDRPIVFVTHMEHHSNQTSWLETIAEVEIIPPNAEGFVDIHHLELLLEKYKDRKLKIAAVTSCSNVTGILTPYHAIAKCMHQHGGLCFVDFACSAPYIDIQMHPEDPEASLDAIYFSPHKFLGGPGTTGILVFNSSLYHNRVPDHPGGGTVEWTNPWGGHRYVDNIEAREDGGTPAFLQTMKVALCIKLKEEMGTERMLQREHELLEIIWERLGRINGLHILAENAKERLGVISFYIDGLHYNLGVKLLNDRFGIQVRGGCSCTGTYGHYLLHVLPEYSKNITDKIDRGDLSEKPGWIRLSIHPTMTNHEIEQVCDAIEQLAEHHADWGKSYQYEVLNNHFVSAKQEDYSSYWKQWFEKPMH